MVDEQHWLRCHKLILLHDSYDVRRHTVEILHNIQCSIAQQIAILLTERQLQLQRMPTKQQVQIPKFYKDKILNCFQMP